LSPKKTVEGFIGGTLATVVFALYFVSLAQGTQLGDDWRSLMLCPVQRGLGTRAADLAGCDWRADGLFVPKPLHLYPGALGGLAQRLLSREAAAAWPLSPAQLHACVMALFASFIAPFGGFLASGFKRAQKIKDFSSVIPGHGGFMDRFDCQLLMGAFAYIYVNHFMQLSKGLAASVAHHFAVVKDGLGREGIEALVGQLQALLEETADAAAAAV
jgi:phosphatidate cytidylyltransferase